MRITEKRRLESALRERFRSERPSAGANAGHAGAVAALAAAEAARVSGSGFGAGGLARAAVRFSPRAFWAAPAAVAASPSPSRSRARRLTRRRPPWWRRHRARGRMPGGRRPREVVPHAGARGVVPEQRRRRGVRAARGPRRRHPSFPRPRLRGLRRHRPRGRGGGVRPRAVPRLGRRRAHARPEGSQRRCGRRRRHLVGGRVRALPPAEGRRARGLLRRRGLGVGRRLGSRGALARPGGGGLAAPVRPGRHRGAKRAAH